MIYIHSEISLQMSYFQFERNADKEYCTELFTKNQNNSIFDGNKNNKQIQSNTSIKIFKNLIENLNQRYHNIMQTELQTNYENSTTKIQINDKGTEIQKERKTPDCNDLQNKKSKERINNWKKYSKILNHKDPQQLQGIQ